MQLAKERLQFKIKVEYYVNFYKIFHSEYLAAEVQEQAAEKADEAKGAASEVAAAVQDKGRILIVLFFRRFFIRNI